MANMQGESVPTLKLGNKDYAPVPVRVESAHRNGAEAKIGYEFLSHEFLTVGSKDVIKVCILVQGKKFYGTAMIKWGGKGADATDPIENAETSAVGRALGFAGFNIEQGIAPAEDVQRALQAQGKVVIESEQPRQIPQRNNAPKVTSKALPEPSAKRSDLLRAEAGKYGYGEGTAWQTLVIEATGRTKEQIVATGLQEADYQAIEKRIALIAKSAAKLQAKQEPEVA